MGWGEGDWEEGVAGSLGARPTELGSYCQHEHLT